MATSEAAASRRAKGITMADRTAQFNDATMASLADKLDRLASALPEDERITLSALLVSAGERGTRHRTGRRHQDRE